MGDALEMAAQAPEKREAQKKRDETESQIKLSQYLRMRFLTEKLLQKA